MPRGENLGGGKKGDEATGMWPGRWKRETGVLGAGRGAGRTWTR